MGRFVGRDPLGFVDGMSLYGGYFVPGAVDPSGMRNCDAEHNACWTANPPWPAVKGKQGHYAYCQAKCQARYMACVAGEGLKLVGAECAEHPVICCFLGIGAILAAVEPTPFGEAAVVAAAASLLGITLEYGLTPPAPPFGVPSA